LQLAVTSPRRVGETLSESFRVKANADQLARPRPYLAWAERVGAVHVSLLSGSSTESVAPFGGLLGGLS